MTTRSLVLASLRHYWRTHLAVVAGVAVAVSVLAGALLVGDSVRASLRQLVDERLGRTALAIVGQGFFREALAETIAGQEGFDGHFEAAAALIALEGALVHEPSGRQAAGVQVYGVDADFFRLHGRERPVPRNREALLSPALGAELGAGPNDALLLRVRKPSAIPASTLQGRRDDTTSAVRLTVRETLPAQELGDFSIRPQQDAVRAVFVPLTRLQRDLDLPGRANLILLSARDDGGQPQALGTAADRLLAASATFEDLGLELHPLPGPHAFSLESETGLLTGELLDVAGKAARQVGSETIPVLTYLANTIRIGDREIPYSVVTGLDLDEYAQLDSGPERSPEEGQSSIVDRQSSIRLNAWAADDLDARPGDAVTLEYFLWSDEGGLSTHTAEFTYAGPVPMEGAGSDRTLTPEYPGLTDARRMGDWDPPFPVDLGRIRPRDEAYWDRYRAAPKGFVPLETARELWSSRYGTATSLRLYVPAGRPLEAAGETLAAAIRQEYGPAGAGLAVQPVRAQAMAASRGATNFGEYFLYFSFFIVVAGLLLTGLFFKLGLEQRAREVGLLFALGFTQPQVRRLLLAESVLLAVAGAAVGLLGAAGFSALILLGLRTWWVDAVGTTRLALTVDVATLAAGAAAGVVIAVITLAVALRRLGKAAPRDLLSGLALMAATPSGGIGRRRRGPATLARPWVRFAGGLLAAVALIAAATAGLIGEVAAFFGAGGALLLASLAAVAAWLRAGQGAAVHGHGWAALSRLGVRQATAHPGRSVLSIALIAFATFVIVAVGAFRRGAPADPYDPASGTGGYALFAESAAPVMYDPDAPDGRINLGIPADDEALSGVRVERFRLRPGEDSSCLNLYRPTSPRIIAPTDAFVAGGGFRFAGTLAETDAERVNPWVLLNRTFADGAIPVIGDANSLQYVLHAPVGSDLVIPGRDGKPLVLRVVAALSDSLFQSELIISDGNFSRLFPRLEGYRFFLIGAPRGQADEAAARLEDALADYGFDAQSSAERLAAYHRVENTYLSTFQTLGGLGLLLGTLGLGAVLLRNVLERRRELALLQAVGFRTPALSLMVVAESLLLLVSGVVIGTAGALVAIVPALAGRGTTFPVGGTVLVIVAVLASGLLASAVATRAAARSPLLGSLRSE